VSQFSWEGHLPSLGLVAWPPEDLAQTVKEVEALDRRIIASEVDIRNPGALTAAVDDGGAEWPGPACLCRG
jgi:hypothetical protein